MTKIKICGITNIDDALAACDAGADALGFVFAEEARKRNRFIELDKAAEIIASLPPYVVTVGVVVNETIERLAQILSVVDRVQLHGDESFETFLTLSPHAYKAVTLRNTKDIDALLGQDWGTLLVDAAVSGERGGTGATGNWDYAKQLSTAGYRVILAGGLTPENVEEAIYAVRPWAVDVSSGVEESPGKKSHERIRTFIANVQKTSVA